MKPFEYSGGFMKISLLLFVILLLAEGLARRIIAARDRFILVTARGRVQRIQKAQWQTARAEHQTA